MNHCSYKTFKYHTDAVYHTDAMIVQSFSFSKSHPFSEEKKKVSSVFLFKSMLLTREFGLLLDAFILYLTKQELAMLVLFSL